MELLALLAIVILGVWVRVDDMALWRQQAELAFVDGLPLLINLDGYYFLSLARDLLEAATRPSTPCARRPWASRGRSRHRCSACSPPA